MLKRGMEVPMNGKSGKHMLADVGTLEVRGWGGRKA